MSPPVHLVEHAELDAGGHRFARALDAAGVAPRATVAVLLANTPEWLQAYRGISISGRRLVPMSWRWTPDDARYVAQNSEASALVADARFGEAALAAGEGVAPEARFAVGGTLAGFRPWADVAAESDAPPAHPLAGDVMLYTSGTTGRPKGVQRAPAPDAPPPNVIGTAGMAMLQHFVKEAGEGAHLVTCPLYHAGPMTYCDGAALLGADVVVMESFDPEECLARIERHRVKSTFMVPTQFVRLLRLPDEVKRRYDLSSLELVCHGAAPVAVEVKRRMIEWLGPVVYEFYGGSEGGGCMIDSRTWLEKPGSVGRPRPGIEMSILDDAGKPVGPGVEGGVYFDLASSPFEYKGDADKTAEGRRGALFTLGDIGRVDEDGFLFLCDRRADVIVSAGVNIYPAQVEGAIFELDFVADCCVVGVPDEEWGEQVRAVVELTEAAAEADREALASELIAHCRERLAGYQVPRAVDFADALPRTETGKLARRAIRNPYWAGRERRI